ncbi:MAG: hypothetical protein ABJG78_12820 [Cyclobacteriaceae bacterium]
MRASLYIALIILVLLGCEEISDQGLDITPESLLVVDGRLTNERIRQEVKLSLTFEDLNQEAPVVTDAFVLINDGVRNFVLTHDASRPGTYLTDTLQALFGKFYTLFINHEGNEYFAFATSAIGTSLSPLSIEELDSGKLKFIYNEAIPSITEVDITWQEVDAQGISVTQRKEAFFYTLDVLDITKTFAPDKEPLIFPKGAVVHRKKYSLTNEHQNFLRSFLSEVDWRGGGFDVAAGNVLTNLSEGAVGYFSVSMVDSDSTLVE